MIKHAEVPSMLRVKVVCCIYQHLPPIENAATIAIFVDTDEMLHLLNVQTNRNAFNQYHILFCFSSATNRASISESDTTKAKEASDFVLEITNHGA